VRVRAWQAKLSDSDEQYALPSSEKK
jgi:hypothetical protein